MSYTVTGIEGIKRFLPLYEKIIFKFVFDKILLYTALLEVKFVILTFFVTII